METAMKTVAELLREGDPLNHDEYGLADRRDQIRQRVITAASGGPKRMLSRRRFLATAAAAGAAILVGGAIIGLGDGDVVQAAVRFELRLAEPEPAPGLVVARVRDSGRMIFLHPELIVTNEDVADTRVTEDGPDRFGVTVQLLETGAQRLQQATAAHIGRPVAILIDGEVVTAPIVRSSISGMAVINGHYTRAEAEHIDAGIGNR
jgi:hypothetical protein